MKTFVATLLGLLSGFMVAAATVGLLGTPNTPGDTTASVINMALTLSLLGVGWVISTFWMLKQAPTLAAVCRRGFLLGAAEWLAMIPLSLFSQAKLAASQTSSLSNASAVGMGIAAIAGVGFSVGMSIVCLVSFAVVYLMGRETNSASGATKQCPLCAETIKAEARRCRFCGTTLPPTLSMSDSVPKVRQELSVGTPVSIGKVLLAIGAVICTFVAVVFWGAWWNGQQSRKPKVTLTPEAQRKHNEEVRELINAARPKGTPSP